MRMLPLSSDVGLIAKPPGMALRQSPVMRRDLAGSCFSMLLEPRLGATGLQIRDDRTETDPGPDLTSRLRDCTAWRRGPTGKESNATHCPSY